jgi:hypothetical protein
VKYASATTMNNICNERMPPMRSAITPPGGRHIEPASTTSAAIISRHARAWYQLVKYSGSALPRPTKPPKVIE